MLTSVFWCFEVSSAHNAEHDLSWPQLTWHFLALLDLHQASLTPSPQWRGLSHLVGLGWTHSPSIGPSVTFSIWNSIIETTSNPCLNTTNNMFFQILSCSQNTWTAGTHLPATCCQLPLCSTDARQHSKSTRRYQAGVHVRHQRFPRSH